MHGRTGELPEIAARAASEKRVFRAALVRRGERILLRQRAANLVNGGFWELPNIEAKKERPAQSFQRLFGVTDLRPKSLCEVKHTIMRFRISLEVFELSDSGLHGGKFLSEREISALPLVSSHRKALEKCGYLKGVKQKQEKT
jgi:adenine-specific DNA glycosylase